jgi:hypothetical protein
MKLLTVFVLGLVLCPIAAQAQKKMQVKIVYRQDNQSQGVYSVPGYSQTNCNGIGSCNQTYNPAQSGTYNVSGATFSLLLPDGRLVVVTCSAKLNWSNLNGVYRSCRQPLTETVDATFSGDNAKLEWVVSLDGRKKQSETYKMIAVLGKNAVPEAKP